MAKKIGYVLSGGGARGFAHLGILKFLEELGIKPYAISGASAGGIAGALYAAGKTPLEILEIMKVSNFLRRDSLLLKKYGIFSMHVLEHVLKENIKEDDFDACPVKLFIVATDLYKGESVYFSKGELFKPVMASASIPVVFQPLAIGDRLLVDGGVLNDFPVEPLEHICDFIIGSHVNRIEDLSETDSLSKTYNILERCFHIAIANAVYAKTHKCDVFMEPPLHNFGMYDVKKADEIFEAGYNTAVQYKDVLQRLLAE